MTVLTAKKRHTLATKHPGVFAGGGPKGKEGFPITDVPHAKLAIGGATRSEHAGNISASKEASIKARARRFLATHGASK